MSESYRKVNYLLRLYKQIERKVIIETLQTINPIISIKDYCYFGFGSVYFADFILFHKYLNINHMTSIDDKKEDEARFKFNKPFGFITFDIDKSSDYLPKLSWHNKLLIWLDYDFALDKETVLIDVDYVAKKAKPHDILILTVESETPETPEKLNSFKDLFSDFISPKITIKDIAENFPVILRDIIDTTIKKGLGSQIKDVSFMQLFNFVYRDTKAMYTYGGIFINKGETDDIKALLTDLEEILWGDKPIKIDCPLLTPREKMALDSLVKKKGAYAVHDKSLKKIGLRKEDVDKYMKYYKYYPQFFESVY